MRMKFAHAIAAALFAASVTAMAAPPAAAADLLAVGAVAPPVAATDQNGGMRNLATLTPNKGVVLLFTRSLHW